MFDVKDSGKREQYASGMVRDIADDKTRYDLVFDGPMLERWAAHLTKGAKKYEPRNWMKAAGKEEAARFRASAVRHFAQWLRGDTDEDHASAVFFNINGYEYVGHHPNAPRDGVPMMEATVGPGPKCAVVDCWGVSGHLGPHS